MTPRPALPARFAWDVRADTFAMIGHNAGKGGREILRQLIQHGYAVNKAAVAASLERQGARNVNWDDPDIPTFCPWNAQADNITLTQHHSGQTAQYIAVLLNQTGFRVTTAEVAANLNRLGEQNVRYRPIPIPKLHRHA